MKTEAEIEKIAESIRQGKVEAIRCDRPEDFIRIIAMLEKMERREILTTVLWCATVFAAAVALAWLMVR